MVSRTTRRFRRCLADLPTEVKVAANAAYKLFRANAHYPSLQFKKVHATEPVYSARITTHHRAVGVITGNEIVWFWIGKHDEYETLLRSL